MIDVESNRKAQKWSTQDQVKRVLWALARPLFWLSPRPFWGFRRGLLRLFGAKIGRHAHIYPSVKITMPWNLDIADHAAVGDGAILYALGPLKIGARSVVSQYAHLCAGTHNWRDAAMPLEKTPIMIGADVWVCANAFVGPRVVVGDFAIIGAGAVVMKAVAERAIMVGNPAIEVKKRS